MVRKLKHHETRLLRKVDLLTYKSDGPDHRSASIRRRYQLRDAGEYDKYNALCGRIRHLAHLLAELAPDDPVRLATEEKLLEKLHVVGVLKRSRAQGAGLSTAEHDVTVSSFCRRRLAVVMVRTRMVEHVSAACRFIEQGHVRVGTDVVTDPAYLVPRGVEDFITWSEGSKILRRVREYRGERDDFELA